MGNYKKVTITFQMTAPKSQSSSMHTANLQQAIFEFMTKSAQVEYEPTNWQVRKRRTGNPS